jgi:hypothetical protein
MGKISKTFTLLLTLIIFMSCLTLLTVKPANAQTFKSITIKADGSIDPSTASLIKIGNVYKVTADIFGNINVKKFNIVLDGGGFSLQGNNSGFGIQIFNLKNSTTVNSLDVFIKNFKIKGFQNGIALYGYYGNNISGVSIKGNTITNNSIGISFNGDFRISNNEIIGNNIVGNNNGVSFRMGHKGDESGNIVSYNQIAYNQVGMYFLWIGDYYSWKPDPFQMDNRIYSNNFIGNSKNVFNGHIIYDPDCANIWDNGSNGNYWSDYNGTDSNNDGIADGNYTIDSNNIDSYPLMSPVVDSQIPPLTVTLTPFPSTDRNVPNLKLLYYLLAISVVLGVVIGTSVLYYRWYRKKTLIGINQ